MFELSQAHFTAISIHHIPSAQSESQISFSETPISMPEDTEMTNAIHQLVLSPFMKYEGYHSFVGAQTDHPLGQLVDQLFAGQENTHAQSRRIAHLLFQNSSHPSIKAGELIVTRIHDVLWEDELVEAIGIFKLESLKGILKVSHRDGQSLLEIKHGYDLGKLDKGCIVYQTNDEQGYVIASLDRTNKEAAAGFWYEDFLKLEPLDDAYFQTQQYIDMAKSYINHQMTEDVDMRKGEQVSMLNDASQYFSGRSSYDEQEFANEVLGGQPEVVESFKKYKEQYAEEMNLEEPLPHAFPLSQLAVRKSAKDFKSVLKLDKNFHVYIHGDRKMIEHGINDDGRKFYKLYYDKES